MNTVGGDWYDIKLGDEAFDVDRNGTTTVENGVERISDFVGFGYGLVDVRRKGEVAVEYYP